MSPSLNSAFGSPFLQSQIHHGSLLEDLLPETSSKSRRCSPRGGFQGEESKPPLKRWNQSEKGSQQHLGGTA